MPKPDFTGKWILGVEASVLSPVVAPVLQSGFVRFERASNWDGGALCFTDRSETPSGEMTISFRYELQNLGPSL